MRKRTRLYVLLGVLLVVCIAAFAVSRHEEKKEQIKSSGDIILEIPTEGVTALAWTNESGTYSFAKEEKWSYEGDETFPVDEEKINDLLEQFEAFAAAFTIDDVEDYSQYGLDDPVCTINITADGESYTIMLGDYSKMDEQRYVSIGGGKAYLALHDPLDEFDAVLSDMILDDTVPQFDTAEQIKFSGNENYTIIRNEDGESICADDVYFADGAPLDTDNVESLLSTIRALSLKNYVSYNASDEELEGFGMNEPDLTIELDYSTNDEEESIGSTGSLLISVSSDPEEAAAYEEALENDEDELPAITHYVRIGQSRIIYKITQNTYNLLTAVSYDTLRHQEIFTADFDTVAAIDVTLNGESYTFTYTPPESEDEEGTWRFGDEEFDISDLKTALSALSASEFTEEVPTGQEEISLTVYLENESFLTFTLTLYRYDGTSCVAAVDGKTVALVPRSKTVDLTEAVNALTLGS